MASPASDTMATPSKDADRWQAAARSAAPLLVGACVLLLVSTVFAFAGAGAAWYTYSTSFCYPGSSTCFSYKYSVTAFILSLEINLGFVSGSSAGATGGGPTIGGIIQIVGGIFTFIAMCIALAAAVKMSVLSRSGAMPPAPTVGGCGCFPSTVSIIATGAWRGGVLGRAAAGTRCQLGVVRSGATL